MGKRKRDYRETLSKYQIHTKSGRMQFLTDVVKAFELLYPTRFRFYINQFKKLRQIYKNSDGSYTDTQGRVTHVDRFPTEPLLFVQRWIPGFGQERGDMDLLKAAWQDFVCTPNKRHFKHRTFWKGGAYDAAPQETKEAEIWGDPEPVHKGRPRTGGPKDREGKRADFTGTGAVVCDDDNEERPGGPAPLLDVPDEVVPDAGG